MLLAAVTLGPLAVLVGAALRLSADAAQEQAEDQVAAAATASAVAVEQELQGLADVVEAFASRPSVRASLGSGDAATVKHAELRFHLAELQRTRAGIAVAFFADRRGVLADILPESPGILGEDFSHRDWYRGVRRTGAPYVSEVYETAAAGGGLVVAAAAPIRSGPGRTDPIQGILVAAYGIGRIQGFVDSFAEAQQVRLTVTDQRGMIVASPGSPPAALVSLRGDADVAAALAGRTGTSRLERDGERVVSTHVPVGDLGWALVADLPSKLALREVGPLRATILALAAVLALVAAAGVWLLHRALRRRTVAEADLVHSRAFLDSVIENIPNMVFVKEASELRFVRFNRAGEELLGYRREDLVGRNDYDFFPVEEADFFVTNDRRVLESGELLDIPAEPIQTRAKGERILHTRKIPICDPDGTPQYLLGISEDITERRRTEAAVEAALAAADQANRAKTQFLSRMSHELRTPLNAVLGFGQLLQLEELGPEQRENVDQIVRAGTHLLELIDEVLDISRMESGQLRLSLEPVRVGDVVAEAVGMVAPLAAARGVRLLVDRSRSEDHVRADRQRLRQVMLNLLVNGVKYNREGGRVTVSCTEAPGGRLRLVVADTGIGVAASNLARLFQPFERLDAEDTGVEGTGLGLALAKQLVEAMGGVIGVESDVGMGSSFWVDLAMAGPSVGTAGATTGPLAARDLAPSVATGPARRVLYVEDNLSNIKLVERIVARRPQVELLVAMQGSVGLDLARQHHPSLVLLDLHLPDMAGEEVLRHLVADPRTSTIPVVVLSADATPGQVQRLRAEGAADYLTKPIDIPRLLAILDGAGPAPSPAEGLQLGGADGAALDAATVAALRELAGEPGPTQDGVRDAVTTYVEEGASRLAGLRLAVSGGDAANTQRLAHSLAGSSATFGARQVAAQCRRLEAQAQSGDLGSAPALVEEVATLFDEAVAALQAELLDNGRRPW